MSEKHTQGKLAIGCGTDIVTFQNGRIMDVASVYCHAIDGRSEANAERLVACWNACQGIDTADLKSGSVSIIQKLHDDVAQRVLEQRDELLAALKVFQDQCEMMESANWRKWEELASPEEFERWVKSRATHMALQARAAIAKVEGGA